jgi:hypothetical protein
MSRKMKLPTPSKRDCKPQPMKCFGSPPTQAELRMISKKSGIPFNKLQELVRDIKRDNNSLGKGTKKKKTRNNTGGITERNKDRLVTYLMVVVAGGSAFYGVPALGNWFVSMGILPRLCEQNMLQHAAIYLARYTTPLPIQTCHEISQNYQANLTKMITALSATGLCRYTNIRDFYSLTHAFIKAKIFGTAEEAYAAETALITAGEEQAASAQTALTEHREQQQQEKSQAAKLLTSEQKKEQENIKRHMNLGFLGSPTEASTKFFSEQGKKKPALKRSASDVGPLGGPPKAAEPKSQAFVPGRTSSPSAASVPLPPVSFKFPTGASKKATLPASKTSRAKKPKSEEKSSKGGITRRRSSRSKRSRRKHRRRK